MGWYLDTWRTPFWRRVLASVCFVGAFVAWQLAVALARGWVQAGEPWGAVVAGGSPGLGAAMVLLAAGAALRLPDATDAAPTRWAEVPAAVLAILSLALHGAGKLASLRDARVGGGLVAAAFAGIGVAALIHPRRGWFSWVWAAAWVVAAGWVVARA